MPYAQVAVDAPAGLKTYSYIVPDGHQVHPGQLVWVPFGSRTVRGVIVSLLSGTSVEAVRPVSSVAADIILTQRQLSLAAFISSRYLSPLFPALALFLPPGIERQPEVVYRPLSEDDDSLGELSDVERDLLRRARQGRLTDGRLKSVSRDSNLRQTLDALVSRGILSRHEVPRERRAKPRIETVVTLLPPDESLPLPSASQARRDWEILQFLASQGGAATAAELRASVAATPARLRKLEAGGLVVLEERRVWRRTLSTRAPAPSTMPLLTGARRLDDAIAATLDRSEVESNRFSALWPGKRGHLRAAAHALSTGRQVICLVPEIALAAQTVERFVSRFPERVALLHSALTPGQQKDEWERVAQGQAHVIVGPRSALFAPVTRPGLIILDEEHEWTFKQDDVAPRYHAREVAREMARAEGAVLLLGSATPDVETYYHAVSGRTHLLRLPERIGGTVGLPPVEVVDMRDELRAGNQNLFSRALTSAIAQALSRHEQVLLFLNRRGTATLVQCRHCGHVFACPRCSVALAYHAVRSRILCHRCGYSTAVPEACPRCRSHGIRYLGIGTQRVVEQVQVAFPAARVVRWDSDVSAGERGGGGLRDLVEGGHVDIVVGTQMVAKGHDFPGVTLVGVISADVGLDIPDYRSSERAFQLISQASGRAGRGVQPGRVVVQTYEPDNYVIRGAAAHDYESFYEEEIRYRREAFYPPYSAMVRLVYSHSDENRCRLEVERVYQLLIAANTSTDIRITGPAPAFVRRLRGRYRWHLTVRGTKPTSALAGISLPRGWMVDVDPVSVA